MARKYENIKQYERETLELNGEGSTHREIGEKPSVFIELKRKAHEQTRPLMGEYINYYHYRIQTKTKLTPLEKRCQYVS